jgi:hypothetical protein
VVCVSPVAGFSAVTNDQLLRYPSWASISAIAGVPAFNGVHVLLLALLLQWAPLLWLVSLLRWCFAVAGFPSDASFLALAGVPSITGDHAVASASLLLLGVPSCGSASASAILMKVATPMIVKNHG